VASLSGGTSPATLQQNILMRAATSDVAAGCIPTRGGSRHTELLCPSDNGRGSA
jgi:hypothetical protein